MITLRPSIGQGERKVGCGPYGTWEQVANPRSIDESHPTKWESISPEVGVESRPSVFSDTLG